MIFLLIFCFVLGIIARSTDETRRNVRAGRRSTIGNRVYGYNRIWGSNPHFSAKRETAIFERELSFLFVFTKPIKNFVQIKNCVIYI